MVYPNTINYKMIENIAAEVDDIPVDSIISKTILNNETLKVVLFGFAMKQELSEHTASMPAIIHILDGEAHLLLGNDEKEVFNGAWIYMEPNLPHSIYAKTPLKMVLILLKPRSQN